MLILILCRLNFDNSAYRYIMKEDEEEQEILPITSDFFFEVFPFNIVFRQVISAPNLVSQWNEAWNTVCSSHYTSLLPKDMVVHNVGSGLATVFPDLDGKKINDAFLLARPLVEFTWNMVTYDGFHRQFQRFTSGETTASRIHQNECESDLHTDYLSPQQPVWDYVKGAC